MNGENTAREHMRGPSAIVGQRGIQTVPAVDKYNGLKNNVLMRPLGNVLYFMPPYVITKKEISFVSEIMKEGVDEATKKNS